MNELSNINDSGIPFNPQELIKAAEKGNTDAISALQDIMKDISYQQFINNLDEDELPPESFAH